MVSDGTHYSEYDPAMAELARTVLASGFSGEPIVEETLATLGDQFGTTERAGAIAYARFLRGSGEEHDRLTMHAVGAVKEFLRAIDRGLK